MSVVAGSNGRKLQKRSARRDGWTKAKRARFLDVFATTCNVRAAAAAVGMSDRSVRALRHRDAQFAVLYDEALQDGYRRLEAELLARALGQQPEDENPFDDEADAVGAGDDENPGAAQRRPLAPPPPFDPQMAIKVLQLRNAETAARSRERRGRVFVRATQEETDAALMKKLDAVERQLKAAEEKSGKGGE
ncbi:MAG TPA: hypothetical protein VFT56_05670 [Sphingomonas sp.]|nr:hypothetical protein [Sphingomonas sp.]